MADRRETIKQFVKDNLKTYQDIALQIHEHPEVSNYEFFASKIL